MFPKYEHFPLEMQSGKYKFKFKFKFCSQNLQQILPLILEDTNLSLNLNFVVKISNKSSPDTAPFIVVIQLMFSSI